MGQSHSSEITVHLENDHTTRDYTGPLLYIVLNFVCLGFFVSILFCDYEISLWGFYFGRGFNMFYYTKGLMMIIHIVAWYIIYVLFYMYIIEPAVNQIVINLIRFKYELQVVTILQFVYGMWLAREILGGWLDLQNSTNCLQTGTCKGFFLERFMLMMESVCEYFGGYDYDEHFQAYYRDPNNLCEKAFRFMPSVITNLFASGIAYISIKLAAPRY